MTDLELWPGRESKRCGGSWRPPRVLEAGLAQGRRAATRTKPRRATAGRDPGRAPSVRRHVRTLAQATLTRRRPPELWSGNEQIAHPRGFEALSVTPACLDADAIIPTSIRTRLDGKRHWIDGPGSMCLSQEQQPTPGMLDPPASSDSKMATGALGKKRFQGSFRRWRRRGTACDARMSR